MHIVPVVLTVLLATSMAMAQASVALSNASASFSQTSNTAWTLTKTGAWDACSNFQTRGLAHL